MKKRKREEEDKFEEEMDELFQTEKNESKKKKISLDYPKVTIRSVKKHYMIMKDKVGTTRTITPQDSLWQILYVYNSPQTNR